MPHDLSGTGRACVVAGGRAFGFCKVAAVQVTWESMDTVFVAAAGSCDQQTQIWPGDMAKLQSRWLEL
jgi:hypothetical protein